VGKDEKSTLGRSWGNYGIDLNIIQAEIKAFWAIFG